MSDIYVLLDDRLSLYSFPEHPFSSQRYFAFKEVLRQKGLLKRLKTLTARKAQVDELLLFHTPDYLAFVRSKEKGGGYLDWGDTPSFPGIFKASALVVGATLSAIDKAMEENSIVFSPVGGLHHAFSDRAGGFCVFNDVGVGINYLRQRYKIRRILYFDIDAHHGDGVYYSFREDPYLYIVDTHQKGIFPGTGTEAEQGVAKAKGTKLNIELEAGSDDNRYFKELERINEFLSKIEVAFIIMQAGADSLAQDPITFLNLTEKVHRKVTAILKNIADAQTHCRMVILGGGGYLLDNIQRAWVSIIEELLGIEDK